jgi:hypothetical protein
MARAGARLAPSVNALLRHFSVSLELTVSLRLKKQKGRHRFGDDPHARVCLPGLNKPRQLFYR